MSIATELSRLAQNIGVINSDTNAIFEALKLKGVTVPADAKLSDVADLIDTIELVLPTINIGGKDYPYVRIGNQLWVNEPINIDSIAHKTRDGYTGYYYQHPSVDSISNMLPDGWRVPSLNDSMVLKSYVEATYGDNSLSALKSVEWGGTNDSGFNAKDYGYYYNVPNESDRWVDDRCNIWTTTYKEHVPSFNKDLYYNIRVRNASYDFDDDSLETQWFPVFAVCDAPGYVTIGDRQYRTVTIGNQEWMAENLDLSVSGIVTGHYPNNDEQTYGYNGLKYGAYYNSAEYAALSNYIQSNYPNWHLATQADIQALDARFGSSVGMDVCSDSEWIQTQGLDTSKLTMRPCGYIHTDSQPYDIGETFLIRTEVGHAWIQPSYTVFSYWNNDSTSMNFGFNVRLVRNIPTYVTIGGRQYRTVTIGNQEWLAENLDYKFQVDGSQIPIGGSGGTTPHAWYYDNNEASYGIDATYKCGLLYNWYAAKYLDDHKDTLLPAGWHVPSNTEWGTLQNQIGLNAADGAKLRALNNSVTPNWPSGWNGTDNYGFNSLPSGDRYYNNNAFVNLGVCADYWTSTGAGTNYYYRRLSPYVTQSIAEATGTPTDGMALRLVRNIT